jgi:signal transduction histidine kinase
VKGKVATVRFPFVFTGWTVSLHSLGSTPEQWARASFMFNMTLSTLIAVVLLGGITLALRAADRAMRLSEMKSDFVSNVSHELRTPLASVRVFGEFLKLGRAPSPEKAKEYGEYIETESRRLSRLIDNILDFSRIESGQKTYEFVEADLEEVLRSTLATFEVRTRRSGFTVEVIGPESPLPPVRIDPDAVGQALHNLLDNAVKYSGEAKEITVRLLKEGDSVVISVRDRGVGIARDEQNKIFERFHRVGTGAIHDVKGSGLGLSIVNHIVRAHRGTVTVESELGRGSTFSIRLPAGSGPERPAEAEVGGAAAPEAPGLPSGAGK